MTTAEYLARDEGRCGDADDDRGPQRPCARLGAAVLGAGPDPGARRRPRLRLQCRPRPPAQRRPRLQRRRPRSRSRCRPRDRRPRRRSRRRARTPAAFRSCSAPTGRRPTTSAASSTSRTAAITSNRTREIGFKLLDNVGPLTSLVLAPGVWNNWHYGGGTVVEASDPKFWYEADLYIKLTATWWEVFSTGVTYTYYTSPNDRFASYQDVGLSFGAQRFEVARRLRPESEHPVRLRDEGRGLGGGRQEGHLHGDRAGPRLHVLRRFVVPGEHQRAHDLRVQPQGLLHGQRRRTRRSATSRAGRSSRCR